MLSLGSGNEFLQFCMFLLEFKVILLNPRRSIREYTFHQGNNCYLSLQGFKDCYKEEEG
jgi:hypothetical protein